MRPAQKAETASEPTVTPAASGGEPAKPSSSGSISEWFQPTIGPRGGRHDSKFTTLVKNVKQLVPVLVGLIGLLRDLIGKPNRSKHGNVPRSKLR